MRWYVYVYYDEDHQPYYVGKGCRDRAFNFHRRAPIPPKDQIIKQYFQEEWQAIRKEEMLIMFWGRRDIDDGGILMNRSTGGLHGGTGAPANEARRRALDAGRKTSWEKLTKNWIVTDPDGKEIQIRNLKRFCEGNNLNVSNLYTVAKGLRAHHKGYKCRYA